MSYGCTFVVPGLPGLAHFGRPIAICRGPAAGERPLPVPWEGAHGERSEEDSAFLWWSEYLFGLDTALNSHTGLGAEVSYVLSLLNILILFIILYQP